MVGRPLSAAMRPARRRHRWRRGTRANGGTGAGANNAPACPNIWGGGGGGSAGTNAGYGNGGAAVFGGGGGAGNNNSTTPSGGASVFGGRGGDEDQAGTAPAGGGGYNSAGARGEVQVRLG